MSTKCYFTKAYKDNSQINRKVQRKNLSQYMSLWKAITWKFLTVPGQNPCLPTCCWNLTIFINCWAPGDSFDPMASMRVWTLCRSILDPRAGELVEEFAETRFSCTTILLMNTHCFSPKESNYYKTRVPENNDIKNNHHL